MIRVLDALHYAHTFTRGDGKALQIVHRDITPTNVLLTDQAEIKLLDFGIARVSGDDTEFLTQRPRVKGKLPYLALEIFKGTEPSAQSDIYSAGVVLYELLTGTNPFLGHQTADIYHKILTIEPPSVHAFRDDAPEHVDRVLARAMHKDAEQRYATAADFARELKQLRRSTEEECLERMRRALQVDFAGPLPEHMGLTPLHERELAWRGDRLDAAELDDEQSGTTVLLSDPAPNAATVAASVPPDVMAAARPEDPTLKTEQPGPEVQRERLPETPASRPRVRARAIFYATAGALLLSAFGLSVWTALATHQSVVVVQQTPPAASKAEPAPHGDAPAPASADEDQPPATPEAEPAPQPEAEPTKPKTASVPERSPPSPAPTKATPAPNPRALTRSFARRQAGVKSCFTKHAEIVDGAPELSIEFTVNAAGKVTKARVLPARVAATPLGRCLTRVARTTRFGPQQHAVAFHIPIRAQRR